MRYPTRSNEGHRSYEVNGDILVIRPRSILFAVEGNRRSPTFIPKTQLLDWYEYQYSSDDDMREIDIRIKEWYYNRRRKEFEHDEG